MKIKDGFLLREVAGNQVVIPTGEAAVTFRGMMSLNGVAAFLWKKLETPTDRDALVDSLLQEYDVERNRAFQDVDDFLKKLREQDFLEE
ncbi:MAG TPA: PqqD family protein [Clostridiales bacterium]|jgi:hypothetical protein|nr:PqqD family protein [Clostridiales bacterium]HCG36394.1 PqqD family protein [Clostridiales bacterium]